MKTQTSKKAIWLRSLLLLPLLAILIYGFSSTQVVEREREATSKEITTKATPKQLDTYNKLAKHYNDKFAGDDSKRIVQLKDLSVMERIYRLMSTEQKANSEPFPECVPPPPPIPDDATPQERKKYEAAIKTYERSFSDEAQAKATPKQIREYNKLAKKYNEMDKDNMWIEKKEVDRMKYLYGLMTEEQRSNAQPFPNIPPPPPAPDAPDAPNEFEFADTPPPPPPPGAKNEFILADPPPPGAKNEFVFADPPPPPPKVDVKEHLKKMNDLGATFFYEDTEVTYNYVLDLVLFNKNLNIQTKTSDANPPVVYISKSFVYKKGND